MSRYRIISSDAHVVEAPDLWERYLGVEHRDRAPKLVKDQEGGDAWSFNGGPPEPIGLVTKAGIELEKLRWTGARYDSIHPGCFTGKGRLEALDADGIDAEILYPPQRTTLWFMMNPDRDFQRAGIDAYNRWVLEDWQGADPARLIPMAQVPNLGIDESVASVRRAKSDGFRGVVISVWPSGGDNISADDDPFWAVCQELGMPVSIHERISGGTPQPQPKGGRTPKLISGMGAAGLSMGQHISAMTFSEMFDRFPELQITAVETGCGWVPFLMEQMDDRYWRNRTWAGSTLKHPPSYYFRNNWSFTFITDLSGISQREQIGVDRIMWSTDFPHHGNDWPRSRWTIEQQFAGVPEAEKQKMICDNVVRMYSLDNGVTAPARPEPAAVTV
jgi:predicted TIM-barrel fold metal-dependent hydrolase